MEMENKIGRGLRIGSIIVLYLFLFTAYVLYGITLINGGNANSMTQAVVIFNVILMVNSEEKKKDLEIPLIRAFNRLNYLFVFAWGISVIARIFM